eukprot:scaffold2182_cov198-Amphora_coffeaeformis.AAC.7
MRSPSDERSDEIPEILLTQWARSSLPSVFLYCYYTYGDGSLIDQSVHQPIQVNPEETHR